jgi:hypothetical protein
MTELPPDARVRGTCSWCTQVRSIASRLQLPIGPKIVLDVRETAAQRGYHLLAAAALMAPHLGRCRLYAISTDHAEEHIAMNVFRFDTGRKLAVWNPKKKRRWWPKPSFDLYLMISDDWPDDRTTRKARRRCRRFLLGLHQAAKPQDDAVLIADGSDTRAYAAKALALLGRRSDLAA